MIAFHKQPSSRHSRWLEKKSLKIATYNVNGINSRLAHLLAWLAKEKPGIVGLQERSEGVQHLIVHRMENYGEMLEGLTMGSRDFR
jgi:hypothetical protein